jgi:hypothetical protein
MMKRSLFFVALCFMAAAFALAQTNEFVDGLLGEKETTYGQVSYLVLVASENLNEDSDTTRAFDQLDALGWAPWGATAEKKVDLASYALILMRAFGLKGGIMYSLFPSPRYAYRELVGRQVIQGRSDPGMKVDGSSAIRMLGRVFDIIGVKQ